MTFITSRTASSEHVGGVFGALLVAVLAFSLLQTMVVPVLPDLQNAFDTTPTVVSWVLSSFLVTSSVATVIVGRLGDMFGKKRLLLASLTVLAIGTLLAAVSDSIGMLIAARGIQGVGAATFPLAFGIVRDTFPRERVPVAIGAISALFGIGFGVGLVIPGPIVEAFGWEWIFWVCLVVIVLAIGAVALFIEESHVRSPGRIDWVGGLLLGVALVAALIAISESQVWDDSVVAGLVAVAATVGTAFVWYERRLSVPLISMALLRRRTVATANLSALIIGFGMYGAFTLVPQYAQTPTESGYGLGASVTESGLYLLPMAVTMLAAGPLAGRLGTWIGFRMTLVTACGIGAVGFAIFSTGGGAGWSFMVGSGVLGVGVGFAFASMANLVIGAVDARQTGEATGINTIARTVGGAIGAQVATAIVAANVVADTSLPDERGYTIAFSLSAIALVVAGLLAFASAPLRPGAPSSPAVATGGAQVS